MSDLHDIGWAMRQVRVAQKVRRPMWGDMWLEVRKGVVMLAAPASDALTPWRTHSNDDLLMDDWELVK